MTLWIIEPRDPLIFGDGKPFTAIPGSRAKSLPFPYPSTIAGCVRTRAGQDPASGRFDKRRIRELLGVDVRGPLLVEIDAMDRQEVVTDWLLPAPADALLLEAKTPDCALRRKLSPLELPSGCVTDLAGLSVVGASSPVKEKPHPHAPRYWRWDAYLQWLRAPADGLTQLATLGHDGPARESRVHVSIEARNQTALEGALFQTSGMEFVRSEPSHDEHKLARSRTLALAVETEASLTDGLDFMGGERRVVRWRHTEAGLPACPDDVRANIVAQRACRMILLTPAHFQAGCLPSWALSKTTGVRVEVVGAAVPRYGAVSGWDYVTGKPKPARRLAPAGSVYFLSLRGDPVALGRFVDAIWMQVVSDDLSGIEDGEQARRDGFGLAIAGAWDGALSHLEVKP